MRIFLVLLFALKANLGFANPPIEQFEGVYVSEHSYVVGKKFLKHAGDLFREDEWGIDISGKLDFYFLEEVEVTPGESYEENGKYYMDRLGPRDCDSIGCTYYDNYNFSISSDSELEIMMKKKTLTPTLTMKLLCKKPTREWPKNYLALKT